MIPANSSASADGKTPVKGESDATDIHAPKLQPSDQELRLPKARMLNRKRVIAAIMLVTGVASATLVLGFVPDAESSPADRPLATEAATQFSDEPNNFTVPDVLRNAPDNTSPLPQPASHDRHQTAEEQRFIATLASTTDATGGKPPKVGAVAPGAYPAGVQGVERSNAEQARIELAERARTGPIAFDIQLPAADDKPKGETGMAQLLAAASAAGATNSVNPPSISGGPAMGEPDQNRQAEKNAFLEQNARPTADYVSGRLAQPLSPYELKAGSIIPATLITGINSDLPGQVVAQVRENVYDTVSGNHLLIPQGSRLLARLDSSVAYGQERVLLCWSRVIRPDGSSLNLECAPGVDLAGQAGFADQVDNHWGKLITGVVLSSLLSAGTQAAAGSVEGYQPNLTQRWAAGVAGELNAAGQQITRKNLAIQPTIKIRPGFGVNVLVSKDLLLTPFRTR